MALTHLLSRVQKLAADNSPLILTVLGVTGSLTTAYLTGKASFRASETLDNERTARTIRNKEAKKQGRDLDPPLDTIPEKAKFVWKLYIPAAGSAVATIFFIVAANRIETRRAATLAAAYSLAEKSFDKYKDKVIETFGDKKEEALRDELAQDDLNQNPVSNRELVITGKGDHLCYEAFTGRYFNSTMENLRRAQNEVNNKVNNNFYASLSDFYDQIGIPISPMSEEFGWNVDRMLDISFSHGIAENEAPCIHLVYNVVPIRGYHRVM